MLVEHLQGTRRKVVSGTGDNCKNVDLVFESIQNIFLLLDSVSGLPYLHVTIPSRVGSVAVWSDLVRKIHASWPRS